MTNQITSFGGAAATHFGSSPDLENLLLPSGRRCSEVSQGDLYAVIAKVVPEFKHTLGRNDALALYSRGLQEIHDTAGRAAVAQFLEANRS